MARRVAPFLEQLEVPNATKTDADCGNENSLPQSVSLFSAGNLLWILGIVAQISETGDRFRLWFRLACAAIVGLTTKGYL